MRDVTIYKMECCGLWNKKIKNKKRIHKLQESIKRINME